MSVENAVTNYLTAHQQPRSGNDKSRYLARAMSASAKTGLVFSPPTIKFIEFLSPLQQDFVFRYPEKLEEISPPTIEEACRLTKGILLDVHVVLKMKGFDISKQSEIL